MIWDFEFLIFHCQIHISHAVAMINIEQGRRWKHYQLTTTNNFVLDKTVMEQVFEVCGYKFTVITPSPSALVFSGNKSEPHFIAQEVADSLGYARNDYLTKQFKPKGLPLLKLTNQNGLKELKDVLNLHYAFKSEANSKLDMTTWLLLIPSSSLEEYLLIYARKPDAKELGKKLYEYLSQGYKVQTELYDGQVKEKHPLHMAIHTETEAEGFSSDFSGWYFKRVVKSRYLRSWNRRERKYNWLMNQSLGFYFSFHLR